MTGRHRLSRKQREHADRLQHAQDVSQEIAQRAEAVEDQISLVDKLTRGWERVHERNHLAQLFADEWRAH